MPLTQNLDTSKTTSSPTLIIAMMNYEDYTVEPLTKEIMLLKVAKVPLDCSIANNGSMGKEM